MLEFLSIDIGTILFTICNLLILVWVFKHFQMCIRDSISRYQITY